MTTEGRREDGANRYGRPIGSDYDPSGGELTPQEAVNRIEALLRRARTECYLPENPEANSRNGGRVRALAQVTQLLRRAGLEPDDGAVSLTDGEEMEETI